MKAIILSVILIYANSFSFAQGEAPVKTSEPDQPHVQMHEQMAKAHQQAADCLKSGKSEGECRESFRDMCKEAGGPDKCGPWMKNHKAKKKVK